MALDTAKPAGSGPGGVGAPRPAGTGSLAAAPACWCQTLASSTTACCVLRQSSGCTAAAQHKSGVRATSAHRLWQASEPDGTNTAASATARRPACVFTRTHTTHTSSAQQLRACSTAKPAAAPCSLPALTLQILSVPGSSGVSHLAQEDIGECAAAGRGHAKKSASQLLPGCMPVAICACRALHKRSCIWHPARSTWLVSRAADTLLTAHEPGTCKLSSSPATPAGLAAHQQYKSGLRPASAVLSGSLKTGAL